MFKADPQGFLVGELIDAQRDLLAVQQQSLTVWRGVRSDVSAIARAMGVSGRASRSPAARPFAHRALRRLPPRRGPRHRTAL